MVPGVDGDDWIVLQAEDHGYDVVGGAAACMGGDESAILAVECDAAAACTLVTRLRPALTNKA